MLVAQACNVSTIGLKAGVNATVITPGVGGAEARGGTLQAVIDSRQQRINFRMLPNLYGY